LYGHALAGEQAAGAAALEQPRTDGCAGLRAQPFPPRSDAPDALKQMLGFLRDRLARSGHD
jgi:hypothetical protein